MNLTILKLPRLCLFSALSVLIFGLGATAEVVNTPPDNVPVKSDYGAWWQDAKFGLFINWNPSCLLEGEISWSRSAPRLGLEDKYNWPQYAGGIPVEIYDNLYKMFNPTQLKINIIGRNMPGASRLKSMTTCTKCLIRPSSMPMNGWPWPRPRG
jgi:hypothetical protein